MDDKTFEPVTSFEPVTEAVVTQLSQVAGISAMVIDFHEVDISKGAGVINKHSKCIWTKKGHRITATRVMSPGGGFIIAQSKDIDPLHDPTNRPTP